MWRAKATDLACPIWLWPCDLWLAHLRSGLNSHWACEKSWPNSSSITRLGDPCWAKGWPGGSSSWHSYLVPAPLEFAYGLTAEFHGYGLRHIKREIVAKSQGIPGLSQLWELHSFTDFFIWSLSRDGSYMPTGSWVTCPSKTKNLLRKTHSQNFI